MGYNQRESRHVSVLLFISLWCCTNITTLTRFHPPPPFLTRTQPPAVPPIGQLPYKHPLHFGPLFQVWYQFPCLPLSAIVSGLCWLAPFIESVGPPQFIFLYHQSLTWPIAPSCPQYPKILHPLFKNHPWPYGPYNSPTWPLLTLYF